MSDTNHFNGIKGCDTWNEMYRLFSNENFLEEDEDIDVYKNIKKNGLYAISSQPTIFPYNDVSKWVYACLDPKKTVILNEGGNLIISLKPDYIHRMYQLKKTNFYLNKQFMDAFNKVLSTQHTLKSLCPFLLFG